MDILVCPLASPGFLYPAVALARELMATGHRVTLLAVGTPVGAEVPLLTPAELDGDRRAFDTARWHTVDSVVAQVALVHAAAGVLRPDLIVTSVLCNGPLLAARQLRLPVVVLGLACHLWPVATVDDHAARWRMREMLQKLAEGAREVGVSLPPRSLPGEAVLVRGHRALSGYELPAGGAVHHVGPLWWEPQLPEHRVAELAGWLGRSAKPVAYVHLGRVFGGETLWPWLNRTFRGGPFRAVVELGRSGIPAADPDADLLVVRAPAMAPYLAAAAAVITNATSAPVLGALRYRLPLLVSPNGSEQPLLAGRCVAARVARPLVDGAGAEELVDLVADPTIASAVDRLGELLFDGRDGERVRARVDAVAGAARASAPQGG